jgi:Na+/H+ antiporter NhaD/arsenite permease-like protein
LFKLLLLDTLVLFGFISLQFVFPAKGLQLAACALLALILATPEAERGDALMVLGLEPVVVIASLFTIASTVQHTSVFGSFASIVNQTGIGRIESVSYLMALSISADGAAAALVHAIHDGSHGSLLSAWQLACGICAGSSAMLTSASAGPILYTLAKLFGNEISFRRYAAFGVPFSLVMLLVSVVYNSLAGGTR